MGEVDMSELLSGKTLGTIGTPMVADALAADAASPT
jgi:hypothetical protein